MTTIRKFNYSEQEVSHILVDTTNGEYIWVSFKQDASGNCALQKLSAHNPSQRYFDIDLEVDEIKKLYSSGSYLYVALNDTSLIARKYSKANPLTTSTDFSIPSGIIEAPVDILVDGSDVFILIPGDASGTNAKICKFTTSGTFVETIDLATVQNARSFTIDSNDDIWIVTYTSPVSLVRVYETSGGTYAYSVTNII